MKSLSFSNKGKRKTNQDLILIEELSPHSWLYIIADGMGGYSHGELAAKLVAENILGYLSSVKEVDQKEIQKAIDKANLAIKQVKKENDDEMGATVAGIVVDEKKVICFWVGDVQIYGFRNNELFFESRSHTLINKLKNNNSLKGPSQLSRYKHVVTRSVHGKIEDSKVSFEEFFEINSEDIFIICSDGVHDLLDGSQIQRLLFSSNSLEKTAQEIENYLIQEADDNFSMIGLNL
jgi:protein phosphatase